MADLNTPSAAPPSTSPSYRAIKALSMPDGTPAAQDGAIPTFIYLDPTQLMVDETYQRALSERSIRLIRKIVAGWDWRRFKPPVAVLIDGRYHLIDGQHTAIAAASHQEVKTIPVMVVEAPELVDRARAFVGHNRDRITVTGTQLHHALIAAGDEDALTIEQVCQRAGVRLLRYPPQNNEFSPGDTLALASIRTVIAKHGVVKARQVLQVLVEAKCAPVSADLIKAAAELLFGPAYAGQIKADDLATTIRGITSTIESEARQLGLAKKLPFWRALVIVLYQRRRGHGSRSAA